MRVLITAGPGGLTLARCRWRDRLGLVLATSRLDRELAAGASPEASILLAMRAEGLTRMRRREGFARSLRHLLDTATHRTTPAAGPLPAQRAIRGATSDLSELAAVITRPGPVAAAGVAQTSLLLARAWGAQYRGDLSPVLQAHAHEAMRALHPSGEPQG